MHAMQRMILIFSFCPGHWAFVQFVCVCVCVTFFYVLMSVYVCVDLSAFRVCEGVCVCCVFTGLGRFIAVSMQDLEASADQVTKHE